MFKNVGKKIMALAQISFFVLSVFMAIVGIKLWVDTEESVYAVLVFLGPVTAWIGSLFVYGFGEMIDNINCIEQNTRDAVCDGEVQDETEDDDGKYEADEVNCESDKSEYEENEEGEEGEEEDGDSEGEDEEDGASFALGNNAITICLSCKYVQHRMNKVCRNCGAIMPGNEE